jgi:hypothetical protein
MSIQRVKFFLILLLVSISTIALSAEDVFCGNTKTLTDSQISAITTNPTAQTVTDLVTACHASAVAIILQAIALAPHLAADFIAAAIIVAPENTLAITQAAIEANPSLAATITAAAIKANPSLAATITATALVAAPGYTNEIAAAALVATQETTGYTSTIPVSSSSESTINNQALQTKNFTAALIACGGNTACINQKTVEMAASSSLTPAEIKAAENSVSPN